MSIEDCYEDKKLLIANLMNEYVTSPLFDDIDSDEDYDLSTDENIELCEELVKMWVKDNY